MQPYTTKYLQKHMNPLARLTLISCCVCLLLALSACDQPDGEAPGAEPKVAVLETYVQSLTLEDDAIQTRFGKLEITHSKPDMPPDTLKLDGKPVYQQEGFYLSLHQYVKQNARDIVLFGSNCGGTACPQNQFHYLLLDKDAPPVIVSDSQFSADPEDVALSVDGDRLLLDLGYQAGKHKTATLQGDKLGISMAAVEKSFLGEENCRWLYDDALGLCREYREADPGCGDPQTSFPGYLTRGIDAIAEHPGFIGDAFDRRCKIACETDKTVDYPTFAKEVCSK
jgi:hypothetical protein